MWGLPADMLSSLLVLSNYQFPSKTANLVIGSTPQKKGKGDGNKNEMSTSVAEDQNQDCLNACIVTFNCARNVIRPEQFAAHLFDVLPQSSSSRQSAPEFLVLSLQEVAPIYHAFLGGSFLVPYLTAFQNAVDIATEDRWPRPRSTNDDYDDGQGDVKYVNVVTHNCGLTALLVFVRADVAKNVAWIDTAEVGVGVQEMGNKGAVGARLGYSVTSSDDATVEFTFVAAHIAPMEDACERRKEDWKNIVERLVFTKSGEADDDDDGEEEDEGSNQTDGDTAHLLQHTNRNRNAAQSGIFTSRSHLFFAGDLNYRTSDTLPLPKDYSRFPQPYLAPDDQSHYSELLKKDQLTREIRAKRTLHGLSEAPITFPPTYKYSHKARKAAVVLIGNQEGEEYREPDVWQWAKNRWPSWCDRILYLDLPSWMKTDDYAEGDSSAIRVYGYNSLPLFPTSDHRPVALAVRVPLRPIVPPPSVPSHVSSAAADEARIRPPFPIDPSWRARRESARMKELVVGGLAYLAMTWEGRVFLLATMVGIFGGWYALRSLLGSEI